MVEQLNDIIKDRYGKGFSIRQLVEVHESAGSSMLRGNDLYIPIQVKDVFLGYGLVHEAHDLSQEAHAHLSKLVRMILEPALYSQHLECTLNNLEIERTQVPASDFDVVQDKRKSIFIFGQHPNRVQKIGLEIHEISENAMYLPLQDVASNMNKVSDFTDLNGVTLVVDLEKNLSEAMQDRIIDYIESDRAGSLLLFVSSRPSYQLFESKLINERLHQHLKDCEFSVDRLPVDKTTMKDVLEMLYFQV